MKVSQLPVLEKEIAEVKARNAELRDQNAGLGDKVSELALLESEAGPKAVRQYRESAEYQEELKRERETFMRRKIREWAEIGWLDIQRMMVEAPQRAEEERARLAASTSQVAEPATEQDGDAAASEDAGEEEEARMEEPAGEGEMAGGGDFQADEEVAGGGEPVPEDVLNEEETQERMEYLDLESLD